MKRLSRVIVSLISLFLLFSVCKIDAQASILDTYFVTLNKGESYQISLEGETPSELVYKSSNPAIASVDNAGLITAKGKGSAFVSVDSPSKTYYFRVSSVVPTLKLNKSDVLIYTAGNCINSAQLRADYTGARKDVTWASVDPSVAVINSVGRVESVSEGSTKIIVSANGLTRECNVKVVKVTTKINVGMINLVTKGSNSTYTLSCNVTGASKSVSWKSSDSTVATVVAGKVTGKKTGRAIITATANGVLSSCVVNVNTTSLKFPTDIVNTPITPYETPTYNIVPITSGITEPIKWTSSNSKVASVSGNGIVVFHDGGTATITAKANGVSDSHTFRVNRPAISINRDQINLFTAGDNNKATLVAKINGVMGDTSDANFILKQQKIDESDDSETKRKKAEYNKGLSIDKKTGLITGKTLGFYEVYAYIPGLVTESQIEQMVETGDYFPSSINENYYKQCRVYVFATPTLSIRDSNRDGEVVTNLNLTSDYYRKTKQLFALIMGPSNKCEWSSSKESVAIVSSTGLVKAIAPGEATISVVANGIKRSCTVTVTETLQDGTPSISINENPSFMVIEGSYKTIPMNTKTILSRKLSATVSGVSNRIKWYTDDTSGLVTVNNKGVVRVNPNKIGPNIDYTTHVYAEANGVRDAVNIHVSKNSLKLDKKTLSLNLSDYNTSYMLIPDARGRNDWGIKWVSSKPEIASVDSSGVVTAHKKGKTIVKASFNGIAASCVVNVYDNSLSIKGSSKTIYYGGEATNNSVIVANVVGASKDVIWESSDTDVAIVTPDKRYSNKCKVTSVSVGNCIITARCNGQAASIPVEVLGTSISLDKTDVNLNTSKKGLAYNIKLNPSIVGSSKSVKWYSSDSAVATVNTKGVVTGKSTGACRIYATANGVSAACNVNVETTNIDITEDNLSLYAYDYLDLGEYKITLHETNQGLSSPIVWKSSNSRVAVVDNTGVVTLVGHGRVKITASSSGVSDSCQIYNNMPVTTLSTHACNLYYGTETGNSYKLNASVIGENKSVIWMSSDPSIVTVESGKLLAMGGGDATVTASANGMIDTCLIHIEDTALDLSSYDMTLTKDYYHHSEQIEVSSLVGLKNKLTYVSSNTRIATVSATGLVTAVSPGTCVIKVTANGITKIIDVTVNETGSGIPTISLNKNDAILVSNSGLANKEKLSASVSGPSNKVTWSSSDTNVVKVNGGIITAVKDGEAIITATANDVSDTCTVKVNKNRVVLDKNRINLNLMGTNMSDSIIVESIEGDFYPGTIVTWKSSNNKIASVDNNGRVRAVGAGNCSISAIINGVATNCSVNVIANTITLNVKTVDFDISGGPGQSRTIVATVKGVNRDITWGSTDPSVAVVSDTGVITALANGGTTIIASANGISATCDVCVYGGNRPPHAHDYIVTVTAQATCVENGHQIKICRSCGQKVEEDIPAIGHILSDEIIAPTHTSQGYTISSCRCGYSIKKDFVPAVGHTIVRVGENASYSEVISQASCSEDGIKRYYCECGYYEDEAIPKIAHTPSDSWVVTKEPTELSAGTESLYCAKCGEELNSRTIPATGHTCEYAISKGGYHAPTLEAAGSIEYKCIWCGNIDSVHSGVLAKLSPADCDHTYEDIEVVYPASCASSEVIKQRCSKCQDERLIVLNDALDENTHLKTNKEVTLAPSYKDDGKAVIKCNYCSFEEEIVVPKLNDCSHEFTKELYSERHKYTVCIMCDSQVGEPEVLSTCSHCAYATKQVLVKEATALSDGLVQFICSTCGCVKAEEIIHSFDRYTIDKGDGSATYVYGYYDDSLSDDILDALNQFRLNNGVNRLFLNNKIQAAADIRAHEISVLYSHVRPNGSDWNSLNRGYMSAENMVVTYTANDTAQSVIDLMKSDIYQKKNLLDNSYKSVAISHFSRVIASESTDIFIPNIVNYYVLEFSED